MESILTKDYTPLGANYNPLTKSVDFSLYSKNASKVMLLIFDKPTGADPILVLNMKKEENDIWKTSVKDYILNHQKAVFFYGYRLFGKNWEYSEEFEENSKIGFKARFDKEGNRFNPNKIAYDPYSKELSHTPSEMGGFEDSYFSNNAQYAVKSVLYPANNSIISKIKPRAFNTEIIGEVHLKDLTEKLDMTEHGTYLGASKFAHNLKELGVTMVEFLPLNEFDSNQNGTNYWGYMPLGYFSLAKKYAFNKTYGNLIDEFHTMVDEFHKNGIKVCLDMVYNHTGEGGLTENDANRANLLSYALIDNSSYYKVFENGYYRSDSGCGNDFNISNKGAGDLIVDSIAYWANQGVDAFRFDLAAALLEDSETCEEFYSLTNSLAVKIKDELEKRGIKVVDDFNSAREGIILIAEPWTCGGRNCYQLGSFPDFWAEWNDKSRDTIRRLTLRPNEITPAHLKEILEGSPDTFKNVNKSVNFIACHDGFSLYDLNAYTRKSPDTKGGSDWEICGNYGDDFKKRENAIRKQLAFLFLSFGIPMIQVGDIIMHTKKGNNNSYCEDNEINYLNWQKAELENGFENRTREYIKNLIKFRNDNPIFQNPNFRDYLTYHYDNGEIADLANFGYWKNYSEKFFGCKINAEEGRIYIALNQTNEKLKILLPKSNYGVSWNVCSDSSITNDNEIKPKTYIEGEYILNPCAMAIFKEI